MTSRVASVVFFCHLWQQYMKSLWVLDCCLEIEAIWRAQLEISDNVMVHFSQCFWHFKDYVMNREKKDSGWIDNENND